MKLLMTGLGLLLLSLLVTVALPNIAATGGEGLAVVGWLGQATLFVGSGLVVAGAVLHALGSRLAEPVSEPPGQDRFA